MTSLKNRNRRQDKDVHIGVVCTTPLETHVIYATADSPIRIDWGDNTPEQVFPADSWTEPMKHEYANQGVYLITIGDANSLTHLDISGSWLVLMYSRELLPAHLQLLRAAAILVDFDPNVLVDWYDLSVLDLTGCEQPAGTVDDILSFLVTNIATYTNASPTITLTGNSIPGVQGVADALTLTNAGWTVTVDA